MTSHQVASRDDWEAERAGLLDREKELTRLGDELARQHRELPWVSAGQSSFNEDLGRVTRRPDGGWSS